MRRRNNGIFSRIGMLILCALVLACGKGQMVHAQDGEIRITLEELNASGSDRTNVEVQLYRVGTVDDEGTPKLDEQYQLGSYPEDSAALEKTAKKLASMVTGDPVESGMTDKYGKICFKELPEGVYLLTLAEGNSYGTMTPFLVPLPYYPKVDGAEQEAVYVIEAEPKASPYKTPVGGQGSLTDPDPPEPPDDTDRSQQQAVSKRPQTADTSTAGMYLLLAVAAMCGIGFLALDRRKRL